MEREKKNRITQKLNQNKNLLWIIGYVVLWQYPKFLFYCYFLWFSSSVTLTQPSTSLLYPSTMAILRSSEIATLFAPRMATAYNSASIATQVNRFTNTSSYEEKKHTYDQKLIKVLNSFFFVCVCVRFFIIVFSSSVE